MNRYIKISFGVFFSVYFCALTHHITSFYTSGVVINLVIGFSYERLCSLYVCLLKIHNYNDSIFVLVSTNLEEEVKEAEGPITIDWLPVVQRQWYYYFGLQ